MHYVEFVKKLHFKPNKNKTRFKVIIKLETNDPCLNQEEKVRLCEWSRTCCMKLNKSVPSLSIMAFRGANGMAPWAVLGRCLLQRGHLCRAPLCVLPSQKQKSPQT